MRRRKVAVLAAAGTVAAAAVLCALGARAAPGPADRAAAAPTVLTSRGDLEQSQTVTGTLGFGASTVVTGRRSGVVTWLPAEGSVIHRGGALWKVDDTPVVLLRGSLPLYRTLSDADGAETGPDVDLIAANLRSLGFWHGPVHDAAYDPALEEAVEAWQRSIGAAPTGVVRAGDAVVAPSDVRIDSVTAHLADDASEAILSVTTTRRTVVLAVPSDLASSLRAGARVPVTLPSGSVVTAVVSAIGPRTTGTSGAPSTVAVTAVPRDRHALDGSVLGPVTARIVTAARRAVVRVPVGALLALAGGGYALQRPDRGLLPVRVGMVADGMAEVEGVAAGVRVLSAS